MKKEAFIILLLTVMSVSLCAQKSPVDDLFDRYDGKEGFTSVYISSKMFSLLSRIDSDDKEFQNLVTRIKGIRILSMDSTAASLGVNFATELMPRLRRNGFEELMTVREENGEVFFMVREEGDRIAELVMITGGGGTSVVSIQGNLDLKTIASLSHSMGIGELEELEKVNR
ncbi:MAG: DUF4252 domain-containing protein [Bacteroidales bacterium]|jgi:hypothetical protein|nr:DUF4252 domain-containing protein [Bacteroidales bacterium]MDD3735936.1 DUF4252 domain-containing protein [Bacteroidales bacterium]NLD64306.1 DUF4252 domain-containing protein [Bacteroidales bacterium]HNT92759.1 DUF4252 domain-containing protein [Bacteroidales bacterium]HOO66293.1 DUF4252 domain-containing protein [Bacteroidales bacterium]